MKKLKSTSILIFSFGCLLFVFYSVSKQETNDTISALGSEKENNLGMEEESFLRYFYHPQTLDEVAKERYEYLKENGSFEKLRLQDHPMGSKLVLNEWENIGPFGIVACNIPGDRNDYNYSGRIISLGQDFDVPDIMYLGAASGGLWKSTDRAVSWTNILDNLSHPSVGSIATNPRLSGEVWIGTGDKGNGVWGPAAPSLGLVYHSINFGNDFQQINFTSEYVSYVSKILIRPIFSTSSDVIFIATNVGVFRSEDGISWIKVLTGNYSDIVYIGSLFDDNFKIVAAKWQSGTSSVISYSDNKGLSGTYVSKSLPGSGTNLGRISLTSSRIGYNQKVYANVASQSGSLAGIWRSDDSGNTWVMKTNPYGTGGGGQMNYNNTILLEDDLISGNTVYTGTNSRELFKTTNGGDTWTSSFTNNPIYGKIHEDQHFIHDGIGTTAVIYVANDGGLYKSTDRGDTFYFIGNNFLSISQIYNLTVSPEQGGLYDGTRYYIATQDDGIQRGPNEFLEWFGLTCCDGMDISFKNQIQYNVIVTGNSSSANRIQRPASTGVCDPWQAFTQGLPDGNFWGAQLIFNGNHFYFKSFVNTSLYRANNGNLPWNSIQNFSGGIYTINISPENIIVAGIDNTIPVRISDTSNTTFNQPSNPSSFWENKDVTDIGFGHIVGAFSRNIYMTLSGTNGIRVVRSTDLGVTFTDITGNLPNMVNTRSILVDPTNQNVIYVGTDFGVYVSFTQGNTWYNHSEHLPAVGYVMDLEFDPYSVKIVAATYGRGVFITDRATLMSVDDDITKVGSFKLFNNYPNPFNPNTTIKFTIQNESFTSLKIYDALGSLVATLVEEDKPAGTYEIEFDASNLSSGTYLYTLVAGNFTETKKMLLVK